MNDQTETPEISQKPRISKRKNIILGVIVGCCALAMYASIFFRLSYNPLQ